jgi:hypothetical protein
MYFRAILLDLLISAENRYFSEEQVREKFDIFSKGKSILLEKPFLTDLAPHPHPPSVMDPYVFGLSGFSLPYLSGSFHQQAIKGINILISTIF